MKWDKFDTIAVITTLMVFFGYIIYRNGYETFGSILFLVGFFVIFANTIVAAKERERVIIKE